MAAVLLSDTRWSSFWAESIATCMPDMCVKYFFIIFIFSPSEPSKVKNHAQNSLFRGVKNHGFWYGFRAAGALRPKVGRVQSAKKNHVRGYII